MREAFRYDDVIVSSEDKQRTHLRPCDQTHGYHMATNNVGITY